MNEKDKYKKLKRSVIFSCAGSGKSFQVIDRILKCISKDEEIVVLDSGFGYEWPCKVLGDISDFRILGSDTTVNFNGKKQVTAFEFDQLNKYPRVLKGIFNDLVDELLALDKPAFLIIDEPWTFDSYLLKKLFNNYSGSILMVAGSPCDLKIMSFELKDFTRIEMLRNTTETIELLIQEIPDVPEDWEKKIRGCTTTGGVNGFSECVIWDEFDGWSFYRLVANQELNQFSNNRKTNTVNSLKAG